MERLREMLIRIDGKGYKAYKAIQGEYAFPSFTLFIDYVQGDPFASPSRMRIRMPQTIAQYDRAWFSVHHRKIALQDFVLRQVAKTIDENRPSVSGTGKSGLVAVDRPGQTVLERTAVVVTSDFVEIRLSVGLPARGRRITGHDAQQLLLESIPEIVRKALPASSLDGVRLKRQLQLADNQHAIRRTMREQGWIAFVANGSLLPRESGVSDRPPKDGKVVPFQSPPTLEREVAVPHGGPIKGMALPKGVHLIVGGGYHGKTTLLKAIERGVYDHISGDGREYVLTEPTAVKIRAEDGRRVEKVDVSPFINRLPFEQDTEYFSTENASGSTSQAANIVEMLEMGTQCLLIDEDTSATNFMIRDGRMQRLVAKTHEPITPFIDRVRQLLDEHGVSTVLVVGGSGDYFDVADTVIMMDHYVPRDVTDQARNIGEQFESPREKEGGASFGPMTRRVVLPTSFQARRKGKEKIDAKGLSHIVFGDTDVDLSALEQLVDPSQTRAIAQMMRRLSQIADGRTELVTLVEKLYTQIEAQGLDSLSPFTGHPGDLAMPRKFEFVGAVNRLRTLTVK